MGASTYQATSTSLVVGSYSAVTRFCNAADRCRNISRWSANGIISFGLVGYLK